MTGHTTSRTTSRTATGKDIAAAATEVIGNRIAALAYDTDSLPQYRGARHGAIRSMRATATGPRSVKVTIRGSDYRYMTAEVLDQAAAEADLGPDAEIIDHPYGHELVW